MWNGCIKLSSEYDHEVEVPEIPKGIPSEKEPWPIGYTKNTAVAAARQSYEDGTHT
jgi:hypothetical protein